MSAEVKLTGQVQHWNLGNDETTDRKYMVVNTNYGMFRNFTKAFFFSAEDGTGEQRFARRARIRKLRNDIQNNKFTPAACYAGVRDTHKLDVEKNKATLVIEQENPLPLTDANHRRSALEELRSQDPSLARKIDNLPITCIIHLDPNRTKEDFINLNDNLSVDAGQLLTMRITNRAVKPKQQNFYTEALEISKLLHTASNSHLYRMVKWDTQNDVGIAFKGLAQSGKSDLATSLYGTAILCKDYNKDAEWGANMILFAYEMLQHDAPELIRKGLVLAPAPDGTVGGSTMIIGLGNMLAHRMKLLERDVPTQKDAEWFVECCKAVFTDEEVGGNFSSQRKRKLMADFNNEFFLDIRNSEDNVIGFHEGIPITLLNLLGTSAFNVSKLEKPKGKRGRKPKATPDTAPETPKNDEVPQETEVDSDVEEIVTESDTDPEWIENDEESPPWDASSDN